MFVLPQLAYKYPQAWPRQGHQSNQGISGHFPVFSPLCFRVIGLSPTVRRPLEPTCRVPSSACAARTFRLSRLQLIFNCAARPYCLKLSSYQVPRSPIALQALRLCVFHTGYMCCSISLLRTIKWGELLQSCNHRAMSVSSSIQRIFNCCAMSLSILSGFTSDMSRNRCLQTWTTSGTSQDPRVPCQFEEKVSPDFELVSR